jgi:alcohol dehydrogenase class IV
MEPAAIGPVGDLGLRKKARLITIPTTSGTGAEATWAIVLTDTAEKRKMGLGHPENMADIAIVDPEMASDMPPQLTADTGLDALVHAVEGYTCSWHTDLTDGLCLQAARLVFRYLPRAVRDAADTEARERMHNAATCAGLGFGNAMASMAHAMGHSLGGAFRIPHGRAVALFLPYTIEFFSSQAPERFTDLAAAAGLFNAAGEQGAREFAGHIRGFCHDIGNPTTVAETGIDRKAYEDQLGKLAHNAMNDTQMVTAVRSPSSEEIRKLFLYAYDGRTVDF